LPERFCSALKAPTPPFAATSISLAFFLAHVPRVLQADIYAMAALVGAVILIVIRRLGISAALAAIAGGVCCFVLRVVATGICRASRIRSHLEHGENLERS
jgi:hypothetical protein